MSDYDSSDFASEMEEEREERYRHDCYMRDMKQGIPSQWEDDCEDEE